MNGIPNHDEQIPRGGLLTRFAVSVPKLGQSLGFGLGIALLAGALVGCRSTFPADWVASPSPAVIHSWNQQPRSVHREAPSFQEGWRNGFQDGRTRFSAAWVDKQSPRFEAYLSSKRQSALEDWQRGYESGFAAGMAADQQHELHDTLFAGPSPPDGEMGSLLVRTAESPSEAADNRGERGRGLSDPPGSADIPAPTSPLPSVRQRAEIATRDLPDFRDPSERLATVLREQSRVDVPSSNSVVPMVMAAATPVSASRESGAAEGNDFEAASTGEAATTIPTLAETTSSEGRTVGWTHPVGIPGLPLRIRQSSRE